MVPQSIINIRMDECLKRNFEFICDELGMTMSTAITVFAKQVCRDKKIPFEISLGNKDQNKEVLIMTKTRFRVCVYPENHDPNIEPFDKTFDDFDSAFHFLLDSDNAMSEKMSESDNEGTRKSNPFFYLEFINPENMYSHLISYGEEGFIYTYNNTESPIGNICDDQFVSDPLDAVYGFVTALNCAGRIVF